MWLFTVHGLFSVVCGRHQAGAQRGRIDRETMMIRARSKEHLASLERAFPELLGDFEISTTPGTDYRHRLIVPRRVWLDLSEKLAEEVQYGNFKSEASRHADETGEKYLDVLHGVWTLGLGLQDG